MSENERPWTPGPWVELPESIHTESCDIVVADDTNDRVAVTCPQRLDGVEIANAHLIAAAPELYEALDLVDKWGTDPDGPLAWDVMAQVKSALAKARGEGVE